MPRSSSARSSGRLAEVGLNCWALMPRLAGPAILGLWFAIPAVRRGLVRGPRLRGGAIVLPVLFVLAFALMIGSYFGKRFEPLAGGPRLGRGGRRSDAMAELRQRRRRQPFHHREPDHPGQRRPARTGLGLSHRREDHSGDSPLVALNFEVTPLKIDDALYLCTSQNTAISIDADTGKEIWRYDPKIDPDRAQSPRLPRPVLCRDRRRRALRAAAADGDDRRPADRARPEHRPRPAPASAMAARST